MIWELMLKMGFLNSLVFILLPMELSVCGVLMLFEWLKWRKQK